MTCLGPTRFQMSTSWSSNWQAQSVFHLLSSLNFISLKFHFLKPQDGSTSPGTHPVPFVYIMKPKQHFLQPFHASLQWLQLERPELGLPWTWLMFISHKGILSFVHVNDLYASMYVDDKTKYEFNEKSTGSMSSETWVPCTGTHWKCRPAYILYVLTCKSFYCCKSHLCPGEDLNFQLLRANQEHIGHISSPQWDDLTTNQQGQLWFLYPTVDIPRYWGENILRVFWQYINFFQNIMHQVCVQHEKIYFVTYAKVSG